MRAFNHRGAGIAVVATVTLIGTGHCIAQTRVAESQLRSSPCANALQQLAVCDAANVHALETMTKAQLEAVTVVQDVRTGALVAFAASKPSALDVGTQVWSLSLSKVFLAASWWDNHQPASTFASRHRSVHEMLVTSDDAAGREAALALRKSVGTQKILSDLRRYGFAQLGTSKRDENFWRILPEVWRERLTPAPASVSLAKQTPDSDWAQTLSIGESNIHVTALHVSRFFQAVGNAGVLLPPQARQEIPSPAAGTRPMRKDHSSKGVRIMEKTTAQRLQAALRENVQRGTATSIAKSLESTGWQIGGKTGSGGPQLDGWFAGLVFDSEGLARFTVATFVRHGGYRGGNAAKISADVSGYILGAARAPAK